MNTFIKNPWNELYSMLSNNISYVLIFHILVVLLLPLLFLFFVNKNKLVMHAISINIFIFGLLICVLFMRFMYGL